MYCNIFMGHYKTYPCKRQEKETISSKVETVLTASMIQYLFFFFPDNSCVISDIACFLLDKWMLENGKGSFSKPGWQFSYFVVMWIKHLPF